MQGDLSGFYSSLSIRGKKRKQEIDKCRKWIENYKKNISSKEDKQYRNDEHSKELANQFSELRERKHQKQLKIDRKNKSEHDDVFEYATENKIVTKCQYCSRVKEWTPQQWRKELINRGVDITENPNPEIVPV